ncbi:MAG: hypothetical protein JWP22_1457 [Ramlibacter sp.]|jgi:hypothetical protein|nr:hypothetical protein [Ramlibacter sp.]MDB5912782.1 hypothetical protein [Ramlibacter sp.]
MFTLSIQRRPAYLLAAASGPADVDENCSGIVFVADMLRRTCSRRLLLDMTALAPRFAGAGALELISTLYSSMPAMEKIAVLVAAGTSHGVVLEVARHRNVPAMEFANVSEADAWLCL